MLPSLLACGLAVLIAPAPSNAVDGTFALRAAKVHVGDGTTVENGIVLVRDGRIEGVGKGLAVPKDVPLLELEGELSPGLVGLVDRSGAQNEDRDSTRTVSDTIDLSYAFAPKRSDAGRLLEEGVTTAVLVPAEGNLVGGLAAAVKPGARVLARRTWLALDLSASALAPDRYPTSYAGAFDELERRFEQTDGSFGRAGRGEQPVLLKADSRAEIQRALDFAARHHLVGAICVGPRLDGLAAALKASGLGVVLPPRPPGSDLHGEDSAAQLARAGIPFGFGLDARRFGASMLRFSAAAAMRAGLERDAALRALTSDAARIAGLGERVGRIAAGLDADLVLWSGDPVSPTSRVLAVWIDGARVYEAPARERDDDDQGGDH